MCKVSVTTVSRAVIIKDVHYILTRSFMIGRYEEKSYTFFFNITFLLHFTERVYQNINSLIPEFISPAVYNQNTIYCNRITQYCLGYNKKFFSGHMPSTFKDIISRNERIFESVWCYKINLLSKKMLAFS